MRKRKRVGLARVGILAIALMVAVGAMGVVYSVWTSAIAVDTTVNTGIIDTRISWGTCWSDVPNIGSISSTPSGMTLDVHVSNAQDGVNYYCDFFIDNDTGTGTLPVKIQSVTITPPLDEWQTTYGFNGDVTFVSNTKTPETVIGDQIDPGEMEDGTIHIYLDGADVGSDFDVTIEVAVVLWSDYEE